MMKYIKNNGRNFNQASNFTPFVIANMKFFAGVFTEIVNILMIVQSENVADVVQNFISLGIISEIDNNVAESMFSFNLGEMEENPIEFPAKQLYVYDWSLWLSDFKKKKDNIFAQAYNLI